MKRRGRKRVLVLLLTAALMAANVSYVYAEESESSSSSDSGSSSSGSSSSSSKSSSSSSDSGSSSSGSSSSGSSSSSDSGSSSSGSSSSGSDSSSSGSSSSSSSDSSSSGSGSSSSSDSSSSGSGSSSGSDSSSSDSSSSSSSDSSSSSGSSSSGSDSSSSDSGSSTESDNSSSESGSSSSEDGGSVDGDTSDEGDSGSTEAGGSDGSAENGAEEGTADGESTEAETGTEAEAEESAEAAETEEGAEAEETEGLETEELETEGLETEGLETEGLETEEAEEEALFINKDGEEIAPSSLVGVDYETIAEGYDGEENVLKSYAFSDEYPAGTVVDSYVDEDGNLILIISQGSEVEAISEEEEESSSASSPAVDGSFTGWDDIPVSYEYNWDNSSNCWYYGVWVTDEDGNTTEYLTEEGTYDTNVRHAMQLYSDDEYVYLHITFATAYGSYANGNDYQFTIDGETASYQIEWADGTQLANSTAEAGTYEVVVRYRDSSWSYYIVDGATAYYLVNEGNVNNELEIKIPLSSFTQQNSNINLDSYSLIQFFTPNLMYNYISCAGSPTGAAPFAAAVFLLVPASYVYLKRKNNDIGGEALA